MNRVFRPLLLCLLAAAFGCQTHQTVAPVERVPETYQPAPELLSGAPIGCEKMLDSFCDALYSPQAKGNLKIGVLGSTYNIFQGTTPNDLSSGFFFYATMKLQRKHLLPKDFATALENEHYFEALREYLDRPPLSAMNTQQRIRDIHIQHELRALWESAKEEVLVRRIRRINPDYVHQTEESLSVDDLKQRDLVRRKLLTEISLALWKGHPNWRKVESSFAEVRDKLLETIVDLDIPEVTRQHWLSRVMSTKLVLPGSLPEIADGDCGTTEANAYFYPRLNVLTVCAGDFNSEDIYQTLSHELSHSIDSSSLSYEFRTRSALGQALPEIKEQACDDEPVNCQEWKSFKDKLPLFLEEWAGYKHDVPALQTCLQRHKSLKPITSEILQNVSEQEIDSLLGDLANSHVFLRSTKDKLPYVDGSWKANPAYLNACRTSRNTMQLDPFDYEDLLTQFFVMEYKCTDTPAPERLKKAITEARLHAVQISKAILQIDGDLSSDDSLISGGYSSPTEEKFADVMGSYTFSRILAAKNEIWARRKAYFASSSWQCSRPSLSKNYPEEAAAELQFSLDTHSAGKDRMREFLSHPLRETLMCSKDFEFEECGIPFRTPFNPSPQPTIRAPTGETSGPSVDSVPEMK